ncbi:MAG: COR domain-containing protein [Pseudomonadota bacterium]
MKNVSFEEKLQLLQKHFQEEFELTAVVKNSNEASVFPKYYAMSEVRLIIEDEKLFSIDCFDIEYETIDYIISLGLNLDLKYFSHRFSSEDLQQGLLGKFPGLESLLLKLDDMSLSEVIKNHSSKIRYLDVISDDPDLFFKEFFFLIDELEHIDIYSLNKSPFKDLSIFNKAKNLKSLKIDTGDVSQLNSHSIEELVVNGQSIHLNELIKIPNLKHLTGHVSEDSGELPNYIKLETINIRPGFSSRMFFSNPDILSLIDVGSLKSISYISTNIPKINRPLPSLVNFSFHHVTARDESSSQSLSLYSVLDLTPNLSSLSVNGAKVDIEECKNPYPKIQRLTLTDAGLDDIRFLQNMPNLTRVNLINNKIKDVSYFSDLEFIVKADLSFNDIINIPYSFGDRFVMLEKNTDLDTDIPQLILGGNPIINPSMEIIRRGKSAIRSYFESMRGDVEELNEAKIIFLGHGSVGKTSLMKRLSGKPFDIDEKMTHGINIEKYPILLEDNTEINAKIWDFGGQQINHTTHQLFLSQRCVYVIVMNDRSEDDQQDQKLEYWLQQVKAYGGDSKAIIIRNKCEDYKHNNLKEGILKDKFPNIVAIESVDCKENVNIDGVKEILNREVASLPMRQMQIPKNWLDVKNEVQCLADKQDHFSLSKFSEICSANGVEDPIAQKTLQDLLNDLSLIIVFPELSAYDMGVLNPYWITDGIYSIINSNEFLERKGYVTEKQVQQLLDKLHPGRYTNRARFIIESLEKFELCHKVGVKKGSTYLVPNLLPTLKHNIDLIEGENTVHFIFKYEHLLPQSIFTKFLVRMSQDISPDNRWKSAAILSDSAFNAKALVIEDSVDRTISIKVTGDQARDYFSTIRKTINDLNHPDEETLGVKELVLLPNSNGATVPYKELLGYEAEKEETYLHGLSRVRYDVSELLSGIESKQDTAKSLTDLESKEIILNVNNHIENNSTSSSISNTTSSQEQTQKQTVKQTVDIALDLKMFKATSMNVLEDLFDEVQEELDDEKALRRVGRDKDKLMTAIEDIQNVENQEQALEKAGSFDRISSFLKGALEGTTTTGEVLKLLRESTGQIKEVAKKYNGIASYFGLPIVPEVLL